MKQHEENKYIGIGAIVDSYIRQESLPDGTYMGGLK